MLREDNDTIDAQFGRLRIVMQMRRRPIEDLTGSS